MLEPFFEAMGNTAFAKYVGESIWIFPLVQAIHLVFLALLAGCVLVVDLRLLGLGITDQPTARLARDVRPWLLTALVGMVATGVPQLMQNALREYHAEYFWYKMYLLAAALLVMVTVRRKATQATVVPAWGKVVGLVSIALWAGVAMSGRLIGLFD
jgi:hypothetical protein